MGWFSWPLFIFLCLTSISSLWWPHICPTMGFWNFCPAQVRWPNIYPKIWFMEIFFKLSAQFIWYLAFTHYCVSLFTPIYFHVLQYNLALWWTIFFPRNLGLVGNRTPLDHFSLWLSLDKVGSDQSWDILSPYVDITCLLHFCSILYYVFIMVYFLHFAMTVSNIDKFCAKASVL